MLVSRTSQIVKLLLLTIDILALLASFRFLSSRRVNRWKS